MGNINCSACGTVNDDSLEECECCGDSLDDEKLMREDQKLIRDEFVDKKQLLVGWALLPLLLTVSFFAVFYFLSLTEAGTSPPDYRSGGRKSLPIFEILGAIFSQFAGTTLFVMAAIIGFGISGVSMYRYYK